MNTGSSGTDRRAPGPSGQGRGGAPAARVGAAAAPAPGETLSLFADCLIVGLLTAVVSLGVVTAYLGLVAGSALLRDRAARDVPVGPRTYWAYLRQVAQSGPAGFLVPPLLAVVITLDVIAVGAGLPGAGALTVVLAVAIGAAVLLGLRTAGTWRPGVTWQHALRDALRHARADLRGNMLLILAGTVAGLLAGMVPLLILLIPGPLALAVAAVESRAP